MERKKSNAKRTKFFAMIFFFRDEVELKYLSNGVNTEGTGIEDGKSSKKEVQH